MVLEFRSKEGERLPDVTFHIREGNDWARKTTQDLFAGKKVIVFGLPGAFTPTCSSAHVPRFNELADVFKENGIDDIICVSVNDAFVMNAWSKELSADKIRFVPDGNGKFTEALGLLVDKDDLGFGKRSWRYSMLVEDGVIKKMFIEQDNGADPYAVSDAETMLKYVNPNARQPTFVTIFTKVGCPFCARAKQMLKDHNLSYEEIVLNKDVTSRTLRAVANASTVPQVFINGKLIGGSEALADYFAQGTSKS